MIAPIWEVEELAAFIFMRELYSFLEQHPSCLLSEAVSAAQVAVRTTPLEAALEILETNQTGRAGRDLSPYREALGKRCPPKECPFADPFHWSAFIIIGGDVRIGA